MVEAAVSMPRHTPAALQRCDMPPCLHSINSHIVDITPGQVEPAPLRACLMGDAACAGVTSQHRLMGMPDQTTPLTLSPAPLALC